MIISILFYTKIIYLVCMDNYVVGSNRVGKLAQLTLGEGLVELQCSVSCVNALFV